MEGNDTWVIEVNEIVPVLDVKTCTHWASGLVIDERPGPLTSRRRATYGKGDVRLLSLSEGKSIHPIHWPFTVVPFGLLNT